MSTPKILLLAAVAALLAGPVLAQSANVPRYEVFELTLTSSKSYANPFTEVTVTAAFTAPSGKQLTATGFHDGGAAWRVRFAPEEVGTFTYVTACSDAGNGGLHGRTGTFTCVSSSNRGFVRPDPARKSWFSHSDGTPFWGSGDTCYYILNGISAADRSAYLDARAAQGFNFIRFHVTGSKVTSPFVGSDYDRFNIAYFQALDVMLAEFKAKRLYGEAIVLSRYSAPYTNPTVWTAAREDRFVRYAVARMAAYTQVFLWSVTNEYEVYPLGRYADPTPEDNAWANHVGELLHATDPHRHPTNVHPWEQPMMDRQMLAGPRFGSSPHIDVLTHQYYGDARLTPTGDYSGPGLQKDPTGTYWIGSGEGVDRVIRLDRAYDKPVINTESSYEYYDGSNYGGWSHTDLCRRQAWRVFMGGGAAHAAGFESTFWALKLDGTPNRSLFIVRDRGLAGQLKHRSDFINTKTNFRDLAPAQSLVNAPNVCLAAPGKEYVVYAPSGGTVVLSLAGFSGSFSAEWLNPRSGAYQGIATVPGGASGSFAAPDSNDWVLHLKASSGSGSGSGLRGEYFDNLDFTGFKLARIDATVNFDWGTGSPAAVVASDTFSVRWTGQVEAPISGTYTFTTLCDDGVRLWVNGQLLINNWTVHPAVENSGSINLTAGQKAPVKMEFYENGGLAVAKLLWSGPGIAKQVVPQGRLYPPTSGIGLKGEYFDNMDFTALKLTRTDPTVNFNWGSGSPEPALVGAGTFSVRWTGGVEAPATGTFTFFTLSDDGVRLWVNNQLLVNNWTLHAPTENSGTIGLTAGQKVAVRMEFFQQGGGSVAKLLWSGPGIAKQLVPQSRLFP